jgi:hypothetical protein
MFGGGAIGTTNSTHDHSNNGNMGGGMSGGRYSDHPIANIRANTTTAQDGSGAQNWIIDTHSG